MRQLIRAVEFASRSTDFSGLNPNAAAARAVDTAENDPAVEEILSLDTPVPSHGSFAYVTNTGDGTVSMIDAGTGEVVDIISTNRAGGSGIAVHPNGSRVYVTSDEGVVSVIDVITRSTVGHAIPVGADPRRIAVTPDPARAYISNYGDGTVSIIDLVPETLLQPAITVGNLPRSIAFAGLNGYVVNAGDSTISVFRIDTNAVVGEPIMVGGGPHDIASNNSGTRLYVNKGDVTVSVIDPGMGTVLGEAHSDERGRGGHRRRFGCGDGARPELRQR